MVVCKKCGSNKLKKIKSLNYSRSNHIKMYKCEKCGKYKLGLL